jgi:transcriptional regulator with XRE-family HTH domain
MNLGRAIKIGRARASWRQSDLAMRLNVSTTYISLLECGKRDISWSLLCRMASVLDFPLDVFMQLVTADLTPEQEAKIISTTKRDLL